MTVDERLVQFLKKGKDWQRKATTIPGIFLLKLPALRNSQESLAIEINPIDATGSATKKRGVVIRSGSELEEISRLLSDPKLAQLAKNIDEVNPAEKRTITVKSGAPEVFEI